MKFEKKDNPLSIELKNEQLKNCILNFGIKDM